MYVIDRIEINPKVMMGKPVIRGTRVTEERDRCGRAARCDRHGKRPGRGVRVALPLT
jgi:hypothetical protein